MSDAPAPVVEWVESNDGMELACCVDGVRRGFIVVYRSTKDPESDPGMWCATMLGADEEQIELGGWLESMEAAQALLLKRIGHGDAVAPVTGAADLRAVVRNEIINTPELRDFTGGVAIEALHQRERWGSAHDAGKTPADWFWLLGHLGGKALAAHMAGDTDKALHHTITAAAALLNWHAAIAGTSNAMRPGIDAPEGGA